MKQNGFFPSLTLAIASLNGHERLPNLMDSIVAQSTPKDDFRVIVIDNNSDTPLEDGLRKYMNQIQLQVVVEPVQGLSNARNRALDENDSDVIVFLDDDVSLSPGLVGAYARTFADASIDAAGGPIRADFGRRRPFWLRGPLKSLYSIQDFDQDEFYRGAYPYGANMAFRAAAIRERFSHDFGRNGSSLMSGEETLFMQKNDFAQIRHVPEAYVTHHIAAERLNLWWLARRVVAQIRTRNRLRRLLGSGQC